MMLDKKINEGTNHNKWNIVYAMNSNQNEYYLQKDNYQWWTMVR